MSVLEICLMIGLGVGTAVYCTILVVKCVKRKKKSVDKTEKVEESDEEIEETRK